MPAETPGAQQIRLEAGICQLCISYQANFDPAHIAAELGAFMDGPGTILVALSGGKDSLCSLFLAKAVLGLDIHALTFDNGFIPEPVLAQSRQICEDLDVPYTIKRTPLYQEFLEEYQPDTRGQWQAKTGLDFCKTCASHVHFYIQQWCQQNQVGRVIYGNRTYARLEPKVSCLTPVHFKTGSQTQTIVNINLPFALRMTHADQARMLTEMGWQDPHLEGVTSNCLIPGFVEHARRQHLGHPTDTGYLENEFRSGAYTAEEMTALQALQVPDPATAIEAFFAARAL